MKVILVFLLALGMIYPIMAYAEPTINLDKNSYTTNETIKVSGKVDFKDDIAMVIQIRSTSDIVAIEQFIPSQSGRYSATFDAIGPKWAQSGQYVVIVSYGGEKSEKTFSFSTSVIPANPEPKPVEPIKQNPEPKPVEPIKQNPEPKPVEPIKQNPEPEPIQKDVQDQKIISKISLTGFPDPNLSPNYYITLYNTDMTFKKLFDSSYTGYHLPDVVGYKTTHISGFPDNDLSPQYYVDRYSNEQRFRVWFDSQFPNNSIYDIIGISDKSKPSIPNWIKQFAQLWSEGQINDSQFASGITELIQQKILLISEDTIKTTNTHSNIPVWFKHTASWYSKGTISDDEFLLGLHYLIENEIILI